MEAKLKTAAQLGKSARLAGLVLATGILSAAFAATSAVAVLSAESISKAGVDVLYWVDPGTGCHYLLTGAGTLTPRNHSDGVQVCDHSEDGWPLDRNLAYGEDGEELLPPAEPYPPTPKTMTAVSPALTMKVVL